MNPDNPLPFVSPGPDVYREEQEREFEFLEKLNNLSAVEYPDRSGSDGANQVLRARVPDADGRAGSHQLQGRERRKRKQLYGLDNETTRPLAQVCLAARRLSERGVRFVQVYHGGSGNAWDAHKDLKKNHGELVLQGRQADRGPAQRSEAARPARRNDRRLGHRVRPHTRAENSNGRDHHPFGFSVWMAGGGIKGGVVHGATDEIGFHAVENRHYVTDVHATVLHQLGIDPKRLDVPGRKRLDVDYGKPIREIIA